MTENSRSGSYYAILIYNGYLHRWEESPQKWKQTSSLKWIYKRSDIITKMRRHSLSKPGKISHSSLKPSSIWRTDLIDDDVISLLPNIPGSDGEDFKEKPKINFLCPDCGLNPWDARVVWDTNLMAASLAKRGN